MTKSGTCVLRRNPARAEEVRKSREDKPTSLRKELDKRQNYLKEHPRVKVETALKKLREKCNRLRLSKWVSICAEATEITLSIDNEALKEDAKGVANPRVILDGCYVLKSDLSPEAATKETIHDRYKDIASVESAFRNSKTAHLELRPIYVALAMRTKGHVFVVMMAYLIIQELAARWQRLNVTVEEGIQELSSLCANEVSFNGKVICNQIPQPRESVEKLLEAADVQMPEALPNKGVIVTTKKKLKSRRNLS